MVIDIYAALADGVWLYDPKQHRLEQRLVADVRSQTGTQDFVGTAPLNLIYVAHGERMQDISPEERRLYASVDTGFIGQNVYLFCASEGLATVFRGAVDTKKLGATMQLGAAKESRSLDGGTAGAASLVKSAIIFGDGFEIDDTRASSPEEIACVCAVGRGTFMGSTPLILMTAIADLTGTLVAKPG